MVDGKRKVLLFSTVKDMLQSQGWSLYRPFNKEYIFKNADGEILAVPQHPDNSRLIYLDELLNRSAVLRREFMEAARPEWALAGDKSGNTHFQFDIWLDPGGAGVWEIEALFLALSDLNRAGGGFGLTLHKTEVIT
ncbi:MAG: hypothetical protein AMJ79_07565 [Phycisphaerae bacterium SM23_30]|nr:MAG: hypothetical protein AMJ79_07565 [Phycisphaerae bacterium SM23_30]